MKTKMMNKEIEGYPAYPIYDFSFKWVQDGEQDPKYPRWYEGLPEGRIWNGSGFSKMYKEEQSQQELLKYALEWWEKMKISKQNEKYPIIDPILTSVYVTLKEYETWVLTWFQHETFDVGQTDIEALKSFEQFVTRKEILNEERERRGENTHALMGAEDRWRWHGSEPNGDSSDHSPAPCRCKYCKEQGVIRIVH